MAGQQMQGPMSEGPQMRGTTVLAASQYAPTSLHTPPRRTTGAPPLTPAPPLRKNKDKKAVSLEAMVPASSHAQAQYIAASPKAMTDPYNASPLPMVAEMTTQAAGKIPHANLVRVPWGRRPCTAYGAIAPELQQLGPDDTGAYYGRGSQRSDCRNADVPPTLRRPGRRFGLANTLRDGVSATGADVQVLLEVFWGKCTPGHPQCPYVVLGSTCRKPPWRCCILAPVSFDGPAEDHLTCGVVDDVQCQIFLHISFLLATKHVTGFGSCS